MTLEDHPLINRFTVTSSIPEWYFGEARLGSSSYYETTLYSNLGGTKTIAKIYDLDDTGSIWRNSINLTIDALYELVGILNDKEATEIEMAIRELRKTIPTDFDRRDQEIFDDSN